MMRVVLDTNVLAAGFTSTTGTSARLLALWLLGRFELVISDHLLAELENAYRDRYFRMRVTPTEVARILQILRLRASRAVVRQTVSGVASHPEDDLILATALNGAAAYLVTFDRKLLALRNFENVEILPSGRFLAILESGDDAGA